MIDEELDALVAILRDGCNLQQRDGEHAAAAITTLRAQLAEAREERDEYHSEAMTYIEKWGAARKAQDEAEAKLAKAVEALELIVVDNTWGLEHQTYMKCRKALAEIKGESHE